MQDMKNAKTIKDTRVASAARRPSKIGGGARDLSAAAALHSAAGAGF